MLRCPFTVSTLSKRDKMSCTTWYGEVVVLEGVEVRETGQDVTYVKKKRHNDTRYTEDTVTYLVW